MALRRKSVSKYHSARKFRRNVRRAKKANFAQPMRGGWRM